MHCQEHRICDDPADTPGICAGLRPPAANSYSYKAQACARRPSDYVEYSSATYAHFTAHECMAVCDADPNCEGFEFGPRILDGRSNCLPLNVSDTTRCGTTPGELEFYKKSPDNIVYPTAYQHMPHACVLGHLIALYPGQSVARCHELCDSDPKCMGFSFDADLVSSVSACRLHSSRDTSGCNGVWWNRDFYKKIPRHYHHEPKSCVLGRDIPAEKYTGKTLFDCAALCDETPMCQGFEYGVGAWSFDGRCPSSFPYRDLSAETPKPPPQICYESSDDTVDGAARPCGSWYGITLISARVICVVAELPL